MIAAILLAVSAPAPLADSLYGTVRVVGTGEPVPGVRISVRGRPETVVSDSAGLYVLRDIPDGRLEVRFERLGFEPLAVSVMLAADGTARVDVDLASVPVTLPPVTVLPLAAAAAEPAFALSEVGRLRLTQTFAARNPLVDASDVVGAVATAPFISGRDELTPSLHVRGGAGDQNLVLLDGIPWHGPRPLGGIVGLMPNGAVSAVDVHTAVPPARYGDALSSIIVVHPRAVDNLTLDGGLDGSMIEQTAGSPLPGGATILASGRWTYRSVFTRPEGGESENGFSDAVGRLSLPAGPSKVDLYYVDRRDRLAFPANPDSSVSAMNQFNSAGSLAGAVWTRLLGPDRAVHARLWSSAATSGAAWGSRTLASRLGEVGFSADYASERTEVGLKLSRTATRYRVQDSTLSRFVLDGATTLVAAHASRLWTPTAPWTVSTGVRLSATATWGVQIEPRVWTRLALGPRVSATLGLARTHQYVQSARNEESVLDAVLGMDLPVASGAGGLPPATSDQVTAALEARLGGRSAVLVEAYARRLSGLVLVAPVTRLPFADSAILVGRGSVQGADASFDYHSGRLDVRAQVGVVATTRTTSTIRYRPSDDAKRASVGVAYHLRRLAVVRVSATIGKGRPTTTLQDGLQLDPYTPMDGAGALTGSPMAELGPLNTTRLPTYARLDLGLSRDWELRGRGAGARINTSLTVTNLLDRRNVLAYVAAPDGARPVFLVPRTLSLRVRWALGGRP